MKEGEVVSLVELCQSAIITLLQEHKFSGRIVKDLYVSLITYMAPSRLSLRVNYAINIRNSVFKLIGMNCPNLVRLDLSDCGQIGNSVVRSILQGCPVLQHVVLDRCRRITDAAFDFSVSPFQALVGCLSLESISLQGCPQITGEIIQTLNKNCRNLNYLNLSQCKNVKSPRIKCILDHSQLRELNLAFIDDMCDDAFVLLPQSLVAGNSRFVHNGSKLEILKLCKSKITDKSIHRIATMHGLVEIRLQWCSGITDFGVAVLVRNCPNLQVIDLKSCTITDSALNSIGEDCAELRELDLSWCFNVSNVGLEKLLPDFGKVQSLEKLSLVWCQQISDESLHILSQIKSLKCLQLSGCCSISNEGIAQIRGVVEEVYI